MRLLLFLTLCALFYCVTGKGGVKALTESMGQEIIEIGNPIKDLPPDIEEEPSAETDDENKLTSSIAPATKKETKKTTTQITRKLKDPDASDEEDVRIEKELAEIYKDNLDYSEEKKADKKINSTIIEKPIARTRNNFKFQPDLTNQKEVEMFRTSVDEISCDNAITTKLNMQNDVNLPGSALRLSISIVVYIISLIFICS